MFKHAREVARVGFVGTQDHRSDGRWYHRLNRLMYVRYYGDVLVKRLRY